jgi:flagellar basal body-associated protein FliL
MEPKKPRSKTLIVIIVVLLVLIGLGFYYVTALRNSDTQPHGVDIQS